MLKFHSTIGGVGRKLFRVKLGVSQTFEVGDVIKTHTNGVADLGVAATPIFGVIQGFVDSKGLPLGDSAVVAGTANGVTSRSVTTDASNSDGYYAIVDHGKDTIYSAKVSGTLGTTGDSDLIGCRLDVDSGNTEYGQLLETTATRTVATTANFFSFGKDPNDATRLLVKIASSELDSDANTEA